jgi:hypothetical protein
MQKILQFFSKIKTSVEQFKLFLYNSGWFEIIIIAFIMYFIIKNNFKNKIENIEHYTNKKTKTKLFVKKT